MANCQCAERFGVTRALQINPFHGSIIAFALISSSNCCGTDLPSHSCPGAPVHEPAIDGKFHSAGHCIAPINLGQCGALNPRASGISLAFLPRPRRSGLRSANRSRYSGEADRLKPFTNQRCLRCKRDERWPADRGCCRTKSVYGNSIFVRRQRSGCGPLGNRG